MAESINKKFRDQIIAAARKRGDAEAERLTNKTWNLTDEFLVQNKVMSSSKLGLEGLESSPVFQTGDATIKEMSVEDILEFVNSCEVKPDMQPNVAMEILRILQGENATPASFFTSARAEGANEIGLERLAGGNAFPMIAADAKNVFAGLEAFGVDMDKVQSDARLNINLTILRAHNSLIDRVLPREAQESNVITLKIPNPTIYDLEKSQDRKSTVRNGSHERPVIDLYKDPNLASTAPKRLIPLSVNDVGAKSVMWGTSIRCGVNTNLHDLAVDENVVNTQHTDFTDLLSEGGIVEAIYIKATKVDGATITDEVFKIPVGYAAQARYTSNANAEDSGVRAATMELTSGLFPTTRTADGSASVILADFIDSKVVLDIAFNSTVNLKNADSQGAGSITADLTSTIKNVKPEDLAPALKTAFNKLSFSIIAYDPKVFYSEENLRKTTTAVRMNVRPAQFEIPVGRSLFVDYSLQQGTAPEDVMRMVSNVNCLGNTARGLSVLDSHMEEVYNRRLFEETMGDDISYKRTIEAEYPAGTLCHPTIYKSTLNYDDVDSPLAVMRESERMTEIHARMRARVLNLVAELKQNSLIQMNYEANETFIWKVVTSGTLRDTVFGIIDYHNPFIDKATTALNADYSMNLPNGDRLDIVGTEFVEYKNTILVFPIRQAAPKDVTSFATIQDRGTFIAQYTPIQNGGVNKRVVVNSREFPFVTNPVGLKITVTNLEKHLGNLRG